MPQLISPKSQYRWTVKERSKVCGGIYDEALARFVGSAPELIMTLEKIVESRDLKQAVEAARATLGALDNFNTQEFVP